MRAITFMAMSMVVITILTFSCSKTRYNPDEFAPIYGTGEANAGELIERLSDSKIYFGHQSVGRNILGGLEAWQNEYGTSLEVVESRDFSTAPASALVHFAVGQNGDPIGKIDDFVSMMEQVPEEENPLAFFKFCYVDFEAETDVESVFAHYKEKMLELKDNYPHISFIACTVPYTGLESGPKAFAKKLLGFLGKAPYGARENMKRKEFNDMIINELGSEFPVFDLGAAESTRPDGSVETFRFKGEEYPGVPSCYRSDLGHLNDDGARIVSYNLLAFLSEEVTTKKN